MSFTESLLFAACFLITILGGTYALKRATDLPEHKVTGLSAEEITKADAFCHKRKLAGLHFSYEKDKVQTIYCVLEAPTTRAKKLNTTSK